MIQPNDLDLHDGKILDLSIDFRVRSLKICVEAYIDQANSSRSNIEITFSKVSNLSSILNLITVEDSSKSGNINYWAINGSNECYIYLQDGCIQINSAGIEVKALD
jgi:hypothetical protein